MVRPISILSSIDQRLTYQMRKRQVVRILLMCFSVLLLFCIVFLMKLNDMHSVDVSRRPRPRNLYIQTRLFPQGGGDVVLDQPWSLASSKLIDNVKFFEQTGKNYLVSNFSYSKGLGNLMFQYASLRSIAEIRGSILIVPVTTTLRRAFKLDAIFATDDVIKELLKSAENSTIEIPSCCSFVGIPNATDKPISAIIGYLQNPRYFYPVNEVLVRREFTFLPSIKNQALLFLSTIVRRRALKRARPLYDNNNAKTGDEAFEMEPSALTDDLYYIGVHVRRGMDIVMNERNLRHGHKAANADYYRRAMQLAKGERENVVFLVCSDNLSWAKKNLPLYDEVGLIFVCPGQYREVDMAILSLCDALILSTGTFSWWSGFLNQKANQIIYYNEWPRSGSDLMSMVNKSEFFPSSWTPLS